MQHNGLWVEGTHVNAMPFMRSRNVPPWGATGASCCWCWHPLHQPTASSSIFLRPGDSVTSQWPSMKAFSFQANWVHPTCILLQKYWSVVWGWMAKRAVPGSCVSWQGLKDPKKKYVLTNSGLTQAWLTFCIILYHFVSFCIILYHFDLFCIGGDYLAYYVACRILLLHLVGSHLGIRGQFGSRYLGPSWTGILLLGLAAQMSFLLSPSFLLWSYVCNYSCSILQSSRC